MYQEEAGFGSELDRELEVLSREGVARHVDEVATALAHTVEKKAYYCSKRYRSDEKLAGQLWEVAYTLRRLAIAVRYAARNGSLPEGRGECDGGLHD
jgi:hypothetical protein